MYEFLLVMGVVLWFVAASLYLRSGVASVFHPATYYLFFHGLIFVVRPIVGYNLDYTFIYNLYDFRPPFEVKNMVLVAADIGFICFMFTAIRFGRAPFVLRPTRFLRADTQREHRRALFPTTLLLGPIGVAALIYWLRISESGVSTMVMSDSHTSVNTDTSGYFTSASDFVGALGVLLAWQFRFRLIAMLPFLAYVGARIAVGGERWSFLLTTAALCLLYLYDHDRHWPNLRTIIIGLLVLFVFVVVGDQRNIIFGYLRGDPSRYNVYGQRFLEGMDFGNMEYFEYLVWAIPSKTGTYGYFIDNLQLLTEPIPRIWWPDKPSGPPIPMWDLFRYGNPIGMSSSLPGIGWAELGLPGVAIWCSAAGALAGKLYTWFVKSRQTGFQVGLYMLLLPMSVQIFRDGGIMTMLKFPLYFIVTVLVWIGFSKIFNPDRRSVAYSYPRL